MLSISVIIVTWNRRQHVNHVIESISHQVFQINNLDVIVVDNASTDDTLEFILSQWNPESIIQNPAIVAHKPSFKLDTNNEKQLINKAGFNSLTVIHNHSNHGGCGGFNTGFAYIERLYQQNNHNQSYPDYIWLVDDDADLPVNALSELVKSAEADNSIGLVGSRTVDINNRVTTLETTIYFDYQKGRMVDTPPLGHPLYQKHHHWVSKTGGTKGNLNFKGIQEVDIVSACSLLARWDAVNKVGFWDYRYFIYCDDADWCLRFKKAGYKVVCNLDAIVYHTPWFSKLTPTRVYYAQRNSLWLMQKVMAGKELKYATFRHMSSILFNSIKASIFRRKNNAELMNQTIEDVINNQEGKLKNDSSYQLEKLNTIKFFQELNQDSKILVVCNQLSSPEILREFLETITAKTSSPIKIDSLNQITCLISDLVLHELNSSHLQLKLSVRVYSSSFISRTLLSLQFFLRPAKAIIIFNKNNNIPFLLGKYTVYIEENDLENIQLEKNSILSQLIFIYKWCILMVKSLIYSVKVSPYKSLNKYG